MNKLIFTPLPLIEESPTSIIKRTILRNGFLTFEDLSKRLGLRPYMSSLSSLSPIVAPLTEEAGSKQSRLSSGFYQPIEGYLLNPDYLIECIPVPKKLIRYRGASFCSECWRDGHEKFIKDLIIAEVCPYHRRKFLYICPHCRKKLSRFGQLDGKCSCGALLVSPFCEEEDALLEKHLLSVFRRRDAEHFKLITMNLKRLNYESHRKDPSLRRVIALGAVALSLDDEQIFIKFLSSQLEIYPDTPIKYIITKLGFPLPEKILNATNIFRENPSTATTLNHIRSPHTFTLTLRQIIKLLKTNHVRAADTILRALGTFVPNKKYSTQEIDKICLLYAHESQIAEAKSRSSLSYSEAARLLNISKYKICALVSNGYLGKIRDIRGHLRIETSSLKLFQFRYSILNLLYDHLHIKIDTFRKAAKNRTLQIISIDSVCLHFIDLMHLPALLKGVKCMHYKKSRKIPHRAKSRFPLLKRQSKRFISLHDAADYLKVNTTVIRICAREGLFSNCHQSLTGKHLFDIKELSEFHKKYIFPTEISKKSRIPRTKISEVLRKIGILPLIGPIVGAGPINLYLRSDISYYELRLALNLINHTKNRKHSKEPTSKEYSPRKSLISTKQLREKFKLSYKDFNISFVDSKIISPINVGREKYISHRDKREVERILKNHYTIGQGNKLFGKRRVANLIRRNILTIDTTIAGGGRFLLKNQADQVFTMKTAT